MAIPMTVEWHHGNFKISKGQHGKLYIYSEVTALSDEKEGTSLVCSQGPSFGKRNELFSLIFS